MPDFALATTADLPLLQDFRMLVRTFRTHHPDAPIVCVGRSDFKPECDKLGVIHVPYDKPWAFYREVVHLKALAITEALRIAPSALFCDADILFLSRYEPKPGIWIAPHYMKASACASYGKYNCGYLASDNSVLPLWWVDHVMKHPEEFGEQQALEHFGEAFTVNEFDDGHNVGWWRLAHADDQAAFAASLQMVGGVLYCWGHRVVSIHTHIFRYTTAKSTQSQDGGMAAAFNKLLSEKMGADTFAGIVEG